MMTPALLAGALACYLLATIRYHKTMVGGFGARLPSSTGELRLSTTASDDDLWSRGRAWMWPALALHTAALVTWSLELGRLPTRGLPETLCLMSWSMTVLYLALASAWRMQALGTLAAPTACLLTLSTLFSFPWRGAPATPAQGQSWLLAIHVTAVVVGYAAFLLASIVALLYFVQTVLLKKKAFKRFLRQMPSLDNLDRVTYRLVALGFPPMLVGMALGFVHAESTGRFLTFDAVMGVLTCAIYAAYMHARIVSGWHGRRVNGPLLVGFVLLVVTYTGRVVVPWMLHH